MTDQTPGDPIEIDFVSGALGYRLRHGGAAGQALARAVGLRKGRVPDVVDATAGLGRDAFLLAALGARVTLIERADVVHAALAAAMERARAESAEHAAIIDRMTLVHGDSITLLAQMAPAVILVDPMHPERRKSALVKKQMRDLRAIVGSDPDSRALVEAAIAAARERVVLKWPARAPVMEGLSQPSHQIGGKTTRYDVFMALRPRP